MLPSSYLAVQVDALFRVHVGIGCDMRAHFFGKLLSRRVR